VSVRVTVQPFGEAFTVDAGESVLSAALRQGRYLKYGCRHGGCGACRALLVEGECHLADRASYALSEADRAAGSVLLCSTYGTGGDIAVDVSEMDLSAEEFSAGGRIGEHECGVEAVEALTDDIRLLRLRPSEPAGLRFAAGQYVEVEVPGSGGRDDRCYSIANPPGEHGRIDLIIKRVPGGRFSARLDGGLRPGDRLRVRGPMGQFTLRLSHRPMVMVATGSGIAPIRSMLHHLAARANQRLVTFFYGARTEHDLPLLAEMRGLEREHGWFRFVPVLSRPGSSGSAWSGATGRVTAALGRHLPSCRGHEAYLCGSPPMVDAATQALLAAGCKRQHIFFDRFVPTG
jgi:alkene monooxygenase reductase